MGVMVCKATIPYPLHEVFTSEQVYFFFVLAVLKCTNQITFHIQQGANVSQLRF